MSLTPDMSWITALKPRIRLTRRRRYAKLFKTPSISSRSTRSNVPADVTDTMIAKNWTWSSWQKDNTTVAKRLHYLLTSHALADIHFNVGGKDDVKVNRLSY